MSTKTSAARVHNNPSRRPLRHLVLARDGPITTTAWGDNSRGKLTRAKGWTTRMSGGSSNKKSKTIPAWWIWAIQIT